MRSRACLLAAVVVLVAACGDTTPTPTPPPTPAVPSTAPSTGTPSPTPVSDVVDLFGTSYAPETPAGSGGTVIIGDWQEATQFNPYYIGRVTEANVAAATWHSLLTIGNDFTYVPQLAAEPIPTTTNGGVRIPGTGGDAMTVTWKIRDGLTWSDGKPLTCDDFRYAWEWVLDADNVGLVKTGFDSITAFDCPTATDMTWHFSRVYEGYLTLMVAPLPRHYLGTIPVRDQVNGAGFRPDEIARVPVSGPFRFESVKPTETRLVRNDGYANPRTGKPANLDGIVFRWYDGPAPLIAAYRDNQIDLATDLQDADIPNLQDLGTQVSEIPALLYEFLRPNWSPGPFETGGDHPNTGGCSRNPAVADRGIGCPTSDPAIRAAIAFAIDKNEINLRLLGGSAQIANTNVSPVAWFYAAQPPAGYDPERARTLLDAAGWTVGPDGIREKGGLKARLELCTTDDQVRRDTMFLVGSWLRNIGIDSVINAVPSTSIFAPYNTATNDTPCAMSRSNFDLALHAFNSSIDPLGYYYTYHSSRFGPLGANYAQVDDPEIDRALDEVRSSVDFGLVRDAMATFQARYVEQTVEVPLFYRKKVELAAPKVGNYVANGTLAGSCWNAEDWFVRG